MQDFCGNSKKERTNSLKTWQALYSLQNFFRLCWISAASHREERAGFIEKTKAFPFTVTGLRGFQEAIITKGGVQVKEVDPKTMESKKTKGLYFAGEVLDLDALTGGYNLQIAWSTAHAAAMAAAEAEK